MTVVTNNRDLEQLYIGLHEPREVHYASGVAGDPQLFARPPQIEKY